MSVGYLVTAVLSALTMSMLWLYVGGAWWSAVIVYVLSGNLVMVGLVFRAYWRKEDTVEQTKTSTSSDETPFAT